MIEDYHFIYSQWNGLLHICLPEPPSTTPGVMHRKFGLKKSFRCFSHSANPLLTGVPAEGFGHLIASAACGCFSLKNGRPFQQFERTLPKNKSTVSKSRVFFLSEGPESWYKFCRILHQVLWNLVPSSTSRPHSSSEKTKYLLLEIIKKNIDSAPVLPQPPIGRERQTNVLKHKISAVNKKPVTPLHEVTSHPLSCYLVNYQNL